MYLATQGYGLGMGDAIQQYQIGQASTTKNLQAAGSVGAGVATAAVGSIAAHLAATSGSIIGLSSATLSAAVPFIGPALMGATLLAQYLITNSGCGVTCVETSEWANQAADALQQNLDAYRALPSPRTQTQRALALATFDSIWQQLQAACGQAGTGNAGVRCITDRQRGACKPEWKTNGQCWNWFLAYRDPIANDQVVPDPTPASVVSSGASDLLTSLESGASGSNLLPLLAIGGLVALAVAL
jgi:hypothetical protein